MSDITLSSGVRSNLLSLQNTADLLATTQERLATGLKVNSALDNPTNFFTASSLNSRASDLSALLDSISNANQTLEAADNGLSAITDLVESAQAAARQALQTSATVEETTDATSAEISSSGFSAVDLSEAGSAATAGAVSFSFGGSTGAFDGVDDEISFDISVDGVNQSVSIDQAAVQGVGNNDSTIDDADELAAILNAQISGATVTNDAGTISITSDTTGSSSSVVITNYAVTDTNSSGFADNTGISNDSGTGTDAVAADTISFDLTVGGTTQTITLDSSITAVDSSAVTAEEIATAINTQFGSSVADGSTGELVITDSTTGSSSAVTIANFATTGNATTSGLSDGTDAGTDESTTEVANPKRDEYVATYNDLLTQIDDLAEDAGFNGVNLLAGDDLSVLFNEDGSSKLDISGVTFDSAGLGLSAIADGGFDDDDDINAVLDTLKDGIDTLRAQASKFGSNLSVVETRQNFTEATINTLETGASNLTLADSNEEAANLLALQTRQQLSSTALSLASQADQQVLSLF